MSDHDCLSETMAAGFTLWKGGSLEDHKDGSRGALRPQCGQVTGFFGPLSITPMWAVMGLGWAPGTYYHFAGRANEILKVAGENVSTVEIERVLNQHPHVLEAAVIVKRPRDIGSTWFAQLGTPSRSHSQGERGR